MGNDNGSEAVKTGVSFIITLVIIGAVFAIVFVGIKMMNSGTAKAEKQNGQAQELEYTQYDGQTLYGDNVISIIRQHEGDEISISVNNGNKTTSYIYENSGASKDGKATLGTKVKTSDEATYLNNAVTKAKSDFYISPTRQFTCYVCRDTNTQAITALYFEPVTE